MARRHPPSSGAAPEGTSADDLARTRDALCDAPRFTGGPSPYIAEFLADGSGQKAEVDAWSVEPLTLDVVAGKNDPVYNDHPYHTKVPYRAIVRYVLHYTRPGEVVLDGFCGSGMTGVAAQLCGDDETLESLELVVSPEGRVLDAAGRDAGRRGARRAVLADLSPLAGLLAYHHNTPVDPTALSAALEQVVADVDVRWGWVQATLHAPTEAQVATAVGLLERFPADPRRRDDLPWATVQFVIWSDVFACPNCGGELVFYEVAVEAESGRVREPFACPGCRARIAKRGLKRVFESRWDPWLEATIEVARQTPVRINYEVRGRRFEKTPDAYDRALWERLERERPPFRVPIDRMPAGRESRRNDVIGLTHVHHFYPPANLWLLGALAARVRELPDRFRQAGLLVHSAANLYASRLRRFRAGKKGGGPLSGTLYVSSLNTPANALKTFARNADVFFASAQVLRRLPGAVRVSVQSSTLPLAPPDSVDYVFVDPPFGGNLMYAELNFLWEAWLGVRTDATCEAVENPTCGKGLDDYRRLLTECFQRFYDALKPERWMTVVFHHSDRRVWHAVQASIRDAGFSIRDVHTLDKRQDSFKQLNHAGSVKHDLVISAIKRTGPRPVAADLTREDETLVWRFVAARLAALPAGATDDLERSECLLYSRVVADCVRRGVEVPLSAADFYAGLRERFELHDGRFHVISPSNP